MANNFAFAKSSISWQRSRSTDIERIMARFEVTDETSLGHAVSCHVIIQRMKNDATRRGTFPTLKNAKERRYQSRRYNRQLKEKSKKLKMSNRESVTFIFLHSEPLFVSDPYRGDRASSFFLPLTKASTDAVDI